MNTFNKYFSRKKSSNAGFTLIELLLAIVIVATLGVALMFGFSRRVSNVNYQFETEKYVDLLEEYQSASASGSIESVKALTGQDCGYRNGAVASAPCVWIGYYLDFGIKDAGGQVPTIFVRPVLGAFDASSVDRPLTLKEYDPYVPDDSAGNLISVEEVNFTDMALQVSRQHRLNQRTTNVNAGVRYSSHTDSEGNILPDNHRQYMRGIGFTNINISSAVFETDPDFSGSVTGNKGNMFMVFGRFHDSGDINISFNDRPGISLVHGADMSGTYCMNSDDFNNWVRFAFGRFESSTSIEKSPPGKDGKDICVRS